MALSVQAWSTLDGMSRGVAKNAGPLRQKMGAPSFDEVVRIGHLRQVGARFARTKMSVDAFRLFDVLPADGRALGNETARKAAGLSPTAYNSAKVLLLKSGEVVRARGGGGALKRAAEIDIGLRAGAVAKESELYEPFRQLLESAEQQAGEKFSCHRVVAHGKGLSRATGQWSRPDVASVVVTDLEYMPGIDITVRTYELKRYYDSLNLAGVYEASAHQRRAHYAFLVIEYPLDEDQTPSNALLEECQRLGVGLIRMWGDDFDELLAPERRSPDPVAINQFVGELLDGDAIEDYCASINKSRPAIPDEELEDVVDG